MKNYANLQPKDGDRVAHCGHIDHDDAPHHFFMFHATLQRPNGVLVKVRWLVCCDSCFKEAGGDDLSVLVRGDFVWTGDAPIAEAI